MKQLVVRGPGMNIRCAVRYAKDAVPSRPWLILGKGPSLDNLGAVDTSKYNVLTLNHACLLCVPTIAHFTDWEAWAACRPFLVAAVQGDPTSEIALCLPWHPHVDYKPSRRTLAWWATDDAVTYREFHRRGRLVSYNSTVAHKLPANSNLTTVRVRYFSAVAAFNLLALAGVIDVDTIGVDGGTGYATTMNPTDRLANGRPSFDVQFDEIMHTVKAYGITWRRL